MTETHTAEVESGDDLDLSDLRGKVTESWHCIDCDFNTAPGCFNRVEMEQAVAQDKWPIPQHINDQSEVYTVQDVVWAKAGNPDGCLCIGCLEKRIGRRLKPKDFPRDRVFNRTPGTERLLSRREWQPNWQETWQ
jgi:hypothetical protein